MLASTGQTRSPHQTLTAWHTVESSFKTTMWTLYAPRVEVPWWQENTPSTQVPSQYVSMSSSQCVLGLQSNVLVGAAPYGLPTNIQTLPEYLNSLNYKSHAVGKWHLGSHTSRVTPTSRGFLSHIGYWTGHEDYFDHTAQELYGPVVSALSLYFLYCVAL